MKRFFTDAPKVAFARQAIIEPNDDVFYITKGYVSVYAVRHGTKNLLMIYKKGETFPLNTLIIRPSRLFELEFRAHTLVYARKLPASVFKDRVFETRETTEQLLQAIAAFNQLLSERIIQLGQKEVRDRLIERLLFLCARFGEEDAKNVTIDPGFTNAEMASAINSTRETVNKIMRDLESKGLLDMSRQTITIHSINKLKAELSTPD